MLDQAFTIGGLLSFLLYVAGIAALVALFLALLNVMKIERNQGDIDHTIKTVPSIMDNAKDISTNVNSISTDATKLVNDVKPEIEKVVATVGSVSDTVNGITRKVDDTSLRVSNTVMNVSDVISDTAKTISLSSNNAIDYFYILREVAKTVKEVFLK